MSTGDDPAFARLLRRLDGKQAPAFILGNGTPHTLGFVRSLGRRGIPAVAVSSETGPRTWSRYCYIDRVVDSEAILLGFLERVGLQMHCQGVLLPTGDAEVLFLSENRARLGRYFRFILPDGELLRRLANKRFPYEYAADVGVLIPRTYCPERREDIRRIAAAISYPCLIKPAYPHLWRRYRRQVSMRKWKKAAHVDTPEQLSAFYDRSQCPGRESNRAGD